jgi:8-oxo-dGTP diphosphatase
MAPVNYVLGFLFSERMDRVLLVKKARPSWQAGKLNGIGGHIEFRESIGAAMEREADEEAGITPGSVSWLRFGVLAFREAGVYVHLFSSHDPGTSEVLIAPTEAQESEPIEFVDFNERFNFGRMLPNLRWLIPMALSNEFGQHAGLCRIEFP